MYIRAKHYQDRTYYAVVHSEREGGKVCQRQVAYLGKHSTLESAISELETRIENTHLIIDQWQTRYNSPRIVAKEKQKLHELTNRVKTLRALQNRMQRRTASTDPTIFP